LEKDFYTLEIFEEQFAEIGMGIKTLAEVCSEIGIDINYAKEKLSKRSI